MERLVPLTKILMTLAVSVWAILLRDWVSLLALVVVELVVLFVAGLLIKQRKAVVALTSFAVFLGIIQFLGSGDITSAIVSGLRMLAMTLVNMHLCSLQHYALCLTSLLKAMLYKRHKHAVVYP